MPTWKEYFRVILLVSIVGFSQIAFAQSSAKAIDEELNRCSESPENATMDMVDCYWNAYTKMDKLLNQVYKSLQSKLSKKERVILRGAQKKWNEFRNAEMDLSIALDPNAGGSLATVNKNAASYALLKARVEQLEQYLSDVSERDQ
jgi:uncharacterized protein YecT (DUF1311 family)